MMYPMSFSQYHLVYNSLSFTLASMMACTVFFFMRAASVSEKYKTAVVTSGLVTLIAGYHYLRIFDSWVEAYEFPASTGGRSLDPTLSGRPFNDAYRYMDWLLTVPLLLTEIVLVQKLTPEEASSKSFTLGFAAALMIILGYPGELILEESELQTRWVWWFLAMVPFIYIVYVLTVGLSDATNAEDNPATKAMIKTAQRLTIASWLTYPIVYLFPMMGVSGSTAVVAIQIGYCIADVIAKCGVGLVVLRISLAKSEEEGLAKHDAAAL
jgi:bacteriorhodopsin